MHGIGRFTRCLNFRVVYCLLWSYYCCLLPLHCHATLATKVTSERRDIKALASESLNIAKQQLRWRSYRVTKGGGQLLLVVPLNYTPWACLYPALNSRPCRVVFIGYNFQNNTWHIPRALRITLKWEDSTASTSAEALARVNSPLLQTSMLFLCLRPDLVPRNAHRTTPGNCV